MENETDAALLSLLEELDESGSIEEPNGYDHEAAVTKFEAFVRDFEREIGKAARVETRAFIQDASFHSQLLPLFEGNDAHWLRFSRFGEMVSIYQDDGVPPSLLRQIVALSRRHGYRFVPYRLLARPYPAADGGAMSDWYRRYFDWI